MVLQREWAKIASGWGDIVGEWRKIATPRFAIGIVTVIGLFGVLIAVYLPNAYTRVLPASVLIGAVVGAIGYRDGFPVDRRPLVQPVRKDTVARASLLVAYLVLFGTITVAYVLGGYRRPIGIQLLTVGLYALVAVSILVMKSPWASLALLIVTGVLHRATIYYASAIQIGNDALFHTRVAAAIVATGNLSPLASSKYWYAPLYHLLVAATSMGFGIPVRDAAFLTVTVAAVAIPPLCIFAFIRRHWTARIGVVGAFLFVVADHAILSSVHVIPTSLGLVWFTVILLYAERYLTDGTYTDLGVYGVALGGLLLTHQLSTFIALVMIGTYVAMTAFWRGRVGVRESIVGALLVAGFLTQAVVTKYGGPAGQQGSFLSTVAPSVLSGVTSGLAGSGRTAGYPPLTAGVAVSGADALTPVQVLGLGVLFCMAVVGVVVWVGRRTDALHRQSLSLGAVAAVTSVIVFGPPAVGVNVFVPSRWFPFVYVVLSILSAPAVGLLLSKASELDGRSLVPVIALLLLTVPYTGLMTMNAYGAADNPVFNDAPAAARITTTPLEAAAYEFVDGHVGQETVVGDFGAWRVIQRHYGQSARVYQTRYGESGTTFTGDQLIVYRSYAETDHASYYLRYGGRALRVYGPLPGPGRYDSTVYSNGEVRMIFHDGGSTSS